MTPTIPMTSADEGRIPVTFRAAVVGTQNLSTEDAGATRALEDVLRQLAINSQRQATPTTPVRFAVVSPLTEGAARMAAVVAIRQGASLEVVLPASPDDCTIGLSEYSRGEFRALLGVATMTTILSPPSREKEASERVKSVMVDRSDVVIVVSSQSDHGDYDSTLIERYAGERYLIPTLRLEVNAPVAGTDGSYSVKGSVEMERIGLRKPGAFKDIDRFNSAHVPSSRYTTIKLGYMLGSEAEPEAGVSHAATLITPYFWRADNLALRYQRRFKGYASVAAILATLAVIAALTELVVFPRHSALTWVEVASLLAVAFVVAAGRVVGWEDRWHSARYLAERLRSAVILAAVGVSDPSEPARWFASRDRVPDWIQRAFYDIWLRIPQRTIKPSDLPPLRENIAQWQKTQASYHTRVAFRMLRREIILGRIAVVSFSLGIIIALVHALGVLDRINVGPQSLGYGSVLVAIIAGAIAQYGAQQSYGSSSEEFARIGDELEELRRYTLSAMDASSLQQSVLRTELLLRPRIVRRFTDIELPT